MPVRWTACLTRNCGSRSATRLKALGYTYVAVELGGYKSGSLNAGLAGHVYGH